MDEIEEREWLKKCRADVIDHLQTAGVVHGHIDDYPAWCCSDTASVWAVETLESPGSIGWWAVCGDHPTDHVLAENIKDPRTILRVFGDRWKEWCSQMLQGQAPPGMRIKPPEHGHELSNALHARANFFLKCATDDDCWNSLKWTWQTSSRRPLYPIKSKETPREIIKKDYGRNLPIRGGWGYTKDDACIIDKNDPSVSPVLPFSGVTLEYVFVEKRIYEEMIIFRRKGEQFSGISWDILEQHLIPDGDRRFDKLIFEITAFRDQDWEELKAEWEGPHGHEMYHLEFNIAHEKKRQDRMIRFTREFWFDITSFL